MAVGVIAAAAAGKRLSKKGRAKAKDKRAKRQDNRAQRKMDRADKAESKGKTGKAAILRAKANVKTEKANKNKKRAGELKKDVKEGKTVGGRIKSAVKKAGGVKGIVKKTPAGRVVGAIKKKRKENKPKRQALKNERQESRARKKAIRKGEGTTKATPRKVKIESGSADRKAETTMKKVDVAKAKTPVVAGGMGAGLYDGPGGPEDPKLGRMSEGPSQYGMNKPGMGMYGKGSKISYGMGNTVGKPGSAKVGTGVNKNPSAMVQRGNVLKHMSRNRK